METWSYLILIAALFALVALMLYAKFSSRSRGKLLHHSPADISLESFDRGGAHSGDPDYDDLSEDLFQEKDTLLQEDRKSISPLSVEPAQPELKAASNEDESVDEDHRKEEEYLDELQEAAAGLAMLMRSSPVQDRTAPVVFAPEEDDASAEEVIDEAPAAEAPQEETIVIPVIDSEVLPVEPVGDLKEADAVEQPEEADVVETAAEGYEVASTPLGDESLEEELVEAEVTSVPVGEEKPKASLLELLGDELAGQFSQIDENLDALEELVSGVEAKLSEWNQGEVESLETVEDEVLSVEEAA